MWAIGVPGSSAAKRLTSLTLFEKNLKGELFMNVNKIKDGDVLTVAIEGSLDIKTSPQLREAMIGELDNISSLIFNLSDCNYTSSAGLRVILESYQILSAKGGNMSIINVNSMLYDTLKLSGFTDFIDIKRAE